MLYSEFKATLHCLVHNVYYVKAQGTKNYVLYNQADEPCALIPQDQMGPFMVYRKLPTRVNTLISHFANTPIHQRMGQTMTLTMNHAMYQSLTSNDLAHNLSDTITPDDSTDIKMTSTQRHAWNLVQQEINRYWQTHLKSTAPVDTIDTKPAINGTDSQTATKDDKITEDNRR